MHGYRSTSSVGMRYGLSPFPAWTSDEGSFFISGMRYDFPFGASEFSTLLAQKRVIKLSIFLAGKVLLIIPLIYFIIMDNNRFRGRRFPDMKGTSINKYVTSLLGRLNFIKT